MSKLENRLRRAKDRRKIHYGDKTPSVAGGGHRDHPAVRPRAAPSRSRSAVGDPRITEPGPHRAHQGAPATPMTVDDALYEMELVGHDFFLFHDAGTDQPTVVYRRHAYDYGLIRLA